MPAENRAPERSSPRVPASDAKRSRSTLARDREIKSPLYARHGIPEAWLFDATSGFTMIYRDASPMGYRTELSPARDAIVSPQLRSDVAISLAEVWLAKCS